VTATHSHKLGHEAFQRLASAHSTYIRDASNDGDVMMVEYDTAYDGHEPIRHDMRGMTVWVYGTPPSDVMDSAKSFGKSANNLAIGKLYHHECDGWTFRVTFGGRISDSEVFMKNRRTDLRLLECFPRIRQDGKSLIASTLNE